MLKDRTITKLSLPGPKFGGTTLGTDPILVRTNRVALFGPGLGASN